MYLLGHLGLGLLAGAVIATVGTGQRSAVAACIPVVLASAPDVDQYVAGLAHRGLTHTVWAAMGVGLVLGLVAWAGSRHHRSGRPATATLAFGAGVVAGLTHLVGDVITPMGIRPFYPLVGTSYTLRLVTARDPAANLALLGVGCLAAGSVLLRQRAHWLPVVRARLRTHREAPDVDPPV